jgi:hypothetical protein
MWLNESYSNKAHVHILGAVIDYTEYHASMFPHPCCQMKVRDSLYSSMPRYT